MVAKILIIEDDSAAADLAKMILNNEGYRVETADEGGKGVAMAKSFMPDVAIVDLMLPNIHGYAVIEQLKADKNLAQIRILVCSAKAYTQDVDGALEVGADDYLTKPYKNDELVTKIKKLLGPQNGNPGNSGESTPTTPSSPA